MSLVCRERHWVGLSLAAVLLIGVAGANVLYFRRVQVHFDFVALWSAGRALAQGLSPYNADAMAALQSPAGHHRDFFSPFYYPLWTGLLFVPLGLLPLSGAAAIWQTLNQMMFLAALGSIAAGMNWRPSLPILGLMALSSLAFHPALVTFLNGQLSILMLFLLAVIYGLMSMKGGNAIWMAVGALLALMMVKPQLALTTMPAFLALLVLRRRWMAIMGFALFAVIMAGASELLVPGWFGDWARDRAQQVVASRAAPSVWGIAHDVLPRSWVPLGGTASIFSLVWLATLWWRHRQSDQIGFLLAMTVIVGQFVTPFLWVYDQTVLLFPFVVGMACVQARPRRMIWTAVFCWWAMVLPYLLYAWANLRDRATGNVLLPVALAGILLSLSWRTLHPPERRR
jgi:hypothetical protein